MMQIGEVATQAGISRDAIRFYEKSGLIHSKRQNNGYRYYDHDIIEVLGLIKLAQSLGFSLHEIQEFLPLLRGGELPEAMVKTVIDEKIQLIDQRILSLHTLRQRLLELPIGLNCPLRQAC
ncbi:MerR family transcriptional regulator [Alkanindiges hydrocarboniclasticus]|nr:MerR family transcriptional regulator [Alkanindiges hydrocarboniclasticus]